MRRITLALISHLVKERRERENVYFCMGIIVTDPSLGEIRLWGNCVLTTAGVLMACSCTSLHASIVAGVAMPQSQLYPPTPVCSAGILEREEQFESFRLICRTTWSLLGKHFPIFAYCGLVVEIQPLNC